ncbi:hypothetical protein [Bifidobacterium eulemuris]|nr:hypothetical protein [Bifidobacterium eulemuris]QOL33014.1 hypothetical protein BE0216_11640 [Bifidobacterium eulemuris]
MEHHADHADHTDHTHKRRELGDTVCRWLVALQIIVTVAGTAFVLIEGLSEDGDHTLVLNFCTFSSTVIITLISIVILWTELMRGFWTVLAMLVLPSIEFVLGCAGATLMLVQMGMHGLTMVGQFGLILAPFLGFLNNAIPTTHQAMKDKELADLRGVHRANKDREQQIQQLAKHAPEHELSPRPQAQSFEEPFRWREIIKSIALALAALAYILGFLWR